MMTNITWLLIESFTIVTLDIFCSACGILRCSPVWCICGHKQLCDGWTSNNKQLDEFIKKSQLQTNSANDAYLEWVPFDCIEYRRYGIHLYGLPMTYVSDFYVFVKLTRLEVTDGTDYDEVTIKYEYIVFVV